MLCGVSKTIECLLKLLTTSNFGALHNWIQISIRHGQIIVFDVSEANDYAMLSRFDVRLLLERESDPPVH